MGRQRRSLVAITGSAISFGTLCVRWAEFSSAAIGLQSAFTSLGNDVRGLFPAARISSPLCKRIAPLRLPGKISALPLSVSFQRPPRARPVGMHLEDPRRGEEV
jgi:hypothetical protein